LISERRLATYPASEIRLAVSRTVASEGARGWKLAKEKQSHKIDVVVALSMACLAAVRGAGSSYCLEALADWEEPAEKIPQPGWVHAGFSSREEAERYVEIQRRITPNAQFPWHNRSW
jgi:hypothetical protein